MSDDDTLDQIIQALTTNQELLDSKKKIKLQDLRTLMADLNFSFLEIAKEIKNGHESRLDESLEMGKKVRSMFS